VATQFPGKRAISLRYMFVISFCRRTSLTMQLQSDFSKYTEQLRSLVRKTCSKCKTNFCYACGEAVSADKVRRPGAATDNDPLFHCPNLQGVILGVGLSMLEKLYADQSQEDIDGRNKLGNSKKRKSTLNQNTPTVPNGPDGEDDDDVYYAAVQSKKGKGGIGYAGDVREDVSHDTSEFPVSNGLLSFHHRTQDS
jgi:hypothetical protein